MKKRMMTAVALICMMSMLTGCEKSNVTLANLADTAVEKYVVLPDYKNLELTRPEKLEITDDYVKSYINNRINSIEEMHEMTGTVENGDVVNIDYAGTIDGTAFEGGTAQSQLLEIGSGSFIAGFEEGLVGAQVGETKELALRFPENYGYAEFAGKDCTFVVKINYILAELTDDNVGLVEMGYESAESYREITRAMLTEYTQYEYERELENSIATALMEGCTFKEMPKSLTEDYESSLRADFENAAEQMGETLEEYMTETYQITADNMDDELYAIARQGAREALVIQAIANAEGISVSEEEVDAMSVSYIELGEEGTLGEESEEEVNKDMIRVNLLYDKVYDFLLNIYKE